jgi:hypothetical protein
METNLQQQDVCMKGAAALQLARYTPLMISGQHV